MLMHNCSKEFLLKFSKPKMSRIPTFMPLSAVLQRSKKGTNTLILLWNGRSKSPAAVSIDKTLMTIRVQPKYGVDPNSLVRNYKRHPSKKRSESFLNAFYRFNLQSFSISLQTKHVCENAAGAATSRPHVLRVPAFHVLDSGVTSSPPLLLAIRKQ